MSNLFLSVEERGAVFSLEHFSEENFDIRNIINRVIGSVSTLLPDQIEVLTNLHEGEEVTDGARNIKQFHPEPFLFMIENQIEMLNGLRVKSQSRLENQEAAARRYELEHQQRLQQLNNTVDGVLSNFHKLEKRVNKIVHIAMSAGQSIESSSQAQDQARFAQFVIRCFLDLNTGDLSRVDPILTSHDERRIIEAGQLIQLLQNISDELNAKNNKRGQRGIRGGLDPMASIDEEDEDDESDDDGDGDGDGLFTKGGRVGLPVTTQLEGGGSQTVTVVVEGDTQTTTTTTTTPDGVTTTVVETVQTTTITPTTTLDFSSRTNVDTFTTAANTIKYLSERIENKLIDKFRFSTLHKDYATAFKYAEVLYTFKDSHYTPPAGSDQNFVKAFTGKKFLYYSYDILSAMRIPKQVERKDLSSARIFTIWFTRVITTIIDVLRDQCEILPLIAPNATQTFEDIVLAVFQVFLPRLIQQVIDHPSLATSDLKSLRTRATMLDLSRRAICEVLCMIEDVSKAVEKRNLEQRQRARFSNDSVKSKQSSQGGLLYQLGTYQQQLQSTELGNALEDTTNANSNAALQQSLYTLFNNQEGITEMDNSRIKSLTKNQDLDAPAFVYGYLAAAMQSMAADAAANSSNEPSTEKKPTLFGGTSKRMVVLSSSSSSSSSSKKNDTTGTNTASIVDKIQPKSLTDIDHCFTAELPPIAAMLRDNITTSLNSFAEGWFDKEYNYLRASLKQIRDDLLLSKFQLETNVQKRIDATRSIFSIPKETLVEVKEMRRQWLQETIMDTEPVDFLFRSLTGAIKRAQVISPPSKRPEHVDTLFLLVAEFLYSQYLYPLAAEAVIRYSPWGRQLYRWNKDHFYNHPTQINLDIPILYSIEAFNKRQKEMGGNGDDQSSSPQQQQQQQPQQPQQPSPKPPRIRSFYEMNPMQQELQLNSILPTMGTRELDYIRNYILEGGKVQVNDTSKLTNLIKRPFTKDTSASPPSVAQSPSSSTTTTLGTTTTPPPPATTTTTTAATATTKDQDKDNDKSFLELSHDEIMYDLIFTLTIFKSCIDIDKRLSSYLTRVVFPHLSTNLTLRSLAQVRLDNTRSNLENKTKQYLSSFAIYISFGFDSILKLIPYQHYKVKSVDSIASSTTKVTALWIQAGQLIESTAAAVIASLSGLNIDDFLHYFLSQVITRILTRITNCGGVSQLGAPLLLQDLAHIQRPVNTIGIPQLISKVQELRNTAFIFFSPYNGIRSFLAERLGVMHIDLDLVKVLVEARADYSTYRVQLQQQLDTFTSSLTAARTPAPGTSAQQQSGQLSQPRK